MRAFWASDEGTAKKDKFLSVDSIRQWFRQRPALGAPDIDGWQGRKHIAFMLKDNDEDFHTLFRNHLILPHLHNTYQAEYANERACDRLSDFQKINGG